MQVDTPLSLPLSLSLAQYFNFVCESSKASGKPHTQSDLNNMFFIVHNFDVRVLKGHRQTSECVSFDVLWSPTSRSAGPSRVAVAIWSGFMVRDLRIEN